MNKHLALLEQLTIWYWDKDSYEFNTWITLSPHTQKYWLNYRVYNHLKDNPIQWENM